MHVEEDMRFSFRITQDNSGLQSREDMIDLNRNVSNDSLLVNLNGFQKPTPQKFRRQ